jgi:hypothetical protein
MSNGLNDLFKKNPSLFLSTHFLNTQPHNDLASVNGIRKINLAFSGTFNSNAVTEVQLARQNRSLFSHAFNAYYLPWSQGQVTSLQLGTGADYFFTAAITGCRLIIGAGTQPLIEHVDGSHFSNNQMDAMCNQRSTGHSGRKRYWDYGNFQATIVVGKRQTGGWRFYAQSFNFNSKLPLQVDQV